MTKYTLTFLLLSLAGLAVIGLSFYQAGLNLTKKYQQEARLFYLTHNTENEQHELARIKAHETCYTVNEQYRDEFEVYKNQWNIHKRLSECPRFTIDLGNYPNCWSGSDESLIPKGTVRCCENGVCPITNQNK